MESKQKKLPLLPGTNHFHTYYTRIFQRKNILHFYCFLLGGFAAKRLENLLTILFLFIHQMIVGLLIEIRNFFKQKFKRKSYGYNGVHKVIVCLLLVCLWFIPYNHLILHSIPFTFILLNFSVDPLVLSTN